MPSTRGSRSSRRCASAWACRATQEIDYADERGIEIPITKASPYSIDVNLWGRSIETGILEDPWVTPPADVYEWTVAPGDAPDPGRGRRSASRAACRSRSTASGCAPVELVERLNALGGAHGVGRIDHVEDRLVGIKSREIYEAPAATILHTRASRARGPDAVARTRCASTGSSPTSWPSSPTTASGSAPSTATCAATSRRRSASCPARCGSGSTTATRSSSADARRFALRPDAGDLRRGRRVRPRRRRRLHRDLRPAAADRGGPPRGGRQAPRRGLVVDRPAPRRAADDRRGQGARRSALRTRRGRSRALRAWRFQELTGSSPRDRFGCSPGGHSRRDGHRSRPNGGDVGQEAPDSLTADPGARVDSYSTSGRRDGGPRPRIPYPSRQPRGEGGRSRA